MISVPFLANSPDLSGSLLSFRQAGNGARLHTDAVRCLICMGVEHRTVFTELGIDILRCSQCGHVFSTFRADPHYAGFWGEEVAPGKHFYWSRARAKMYGAFFRRFIAGRSGCLLDMGSGLGFFLKAAAVYAAWEVYGCEISPAAVKYAREQLGLINVVCSRLQEANLPAESFDMITMWDVLDHITPILC